MPAEPHPDAVAPARTVVPCRTVMPYRLIRQMIGQICYPSAGARRAARRRPVAPPCGARGAAPQDGAGQRRTAAGRDLAAGQPAPDRSIEPVRRALTLLLVVLAAGLVGCSGRGPAL